ncbi:hypothetical protein [Solimicrobium silvestre]|uniref:PEGA domain-containing protein n=1 Tax=Solimicrobium silvestre TaxID=2099400 RepID=A0A2S9GYV9_9BURK|nr:hypothetical protein [Solimicrobium silvestre]PRC92909.1 hypothetical protein S2091_2326 [Solimicrobium silvestre]
MSKLIVQRHKAIWQDAARDYVILVDGKELGRVGNGSEIEIQIKPGTHTVQLKIDWCRSPKITITVATEQAITLDCGPNSTPLLALIYIIFLRKNYLWLRAN